MKAKEAPERIQLGFVENENHSLKIRGISYLEEKQYGLTEYIRKDAFIEKACEFLKSYRQEIFDGLGYIAGIVNDETIEDFRKYMEE